MRLDAREGAYFGWEVYHAVRCEMLRHVVWVDSDVACWGEYAYPFQIVGDELVIRERQATRIDIHLDRKLVVIDPIEDATLPAAETSQPVDNFQRYSPAMASTGAKRLEIASVLGPVESELCGVRGRSK